MKVLVYYQVQEGLSTVDELQKMKLKVEKENWEFYKLVIENQNEYERLMDVIMNTFKKVDVFYFYNNNIFDDFYWNLISQSAKIENVLLMEYHRK